MTLEQELENIIKSKPDETVVHLAEHLGGVPLSFSRCGLDTDLLRSPSASDMKKRPSKCSKCFQDPPEEMLMALIS